MDLQQNIQSGQEQCTLSEQIAAEKPYQLEKISIQINSLHHQLSYQNCTLQITESCVTLIIAQTQETQKILNIMFSNISSVGIESDNLLVFLEGSDNFQQEEEQENQNGQVTHLMPQTIKLIQDSQKGNFNVSGNFTISLSLKGLNPQIRNQVHQIMIGYLKSEGEEQEQQNCMGEMISAGQINEDGTINNFQIQNSQHSDNSQSDQQNQKMA